MLARIKAMKIYDSKAREKREFVPIEEGKVKMYLCGPTVYDFLHVGNFRGVIFFNTVRNWLETKGYEVTYVYNYTDVDDKIINRAKEENKSAVDVANTYIAEFEKDFSQLKLKSHSANPRVTDHIENIIEFIKKLVDKKHAYSVNGDVYFDVLSYEKYGHLSGKNLDDLESGYRIEVNKDKKHSSDFALWKSAKGEEVSWDSPWGEGRPGWHIECSVMATALLGDTIDIHGGGLDLIFPHHENEIAQSEACTGHTFANFWMHNNMLEFGNQKMSKSLGNIRTGRSFLEEYNAEILKFIMLNVHYRSTIDFSGDQILRAAKSLAKFYSAFNLASQLIAKEAPLVPVPKDFQDALNDAEKGFAHAMDEDFSTAGAIARMFELLRLFNNKVNVTKFAPEHKAVAEVFLGFVKSKGVLLSLFQESAPEFLKELDDILLKQKSLSRVEVDSLVNQRIEARNNKDWAKADELRDKIKDLGIIVKDSAEGTAWEVDKSID